MPGSVGFTRCESKGNTLFEIVRYCLLILFRPSSDPFLGQSGPSNRVQLSPMAASFTPISMTGSIAGQSQIESPLTRDFSSVGHLAANSDPETHGPGAGIIRFSEPNMPEYGPVGNTHFARNSFTSSVPIEKLDSERRSRAFVIENVPTNLSYMALAGFFNVGSLAKAMCLISPMLTKSK